MGLVVRPVEKSQDEIIAEWDSAADIRHKQIVSGLDISYHEVLKPAILTVLSEYSTLDSILDVGCGSGVLTHELSKYANDIVGIDPSPKSIRLAQSECRSHNISYMIRTLEEHARYAPDSASIIVSNMVWMDVLDLNAALEAAREVIKPHGRLLSTITHPFFWPEYWNYAQEAWFNYQSVQTIEAPLQIALSESPGPVTTHVHRPMARYINAFVRAGFTIKMFSELGLPPDSPAPERAKRYPRFAFFVCESG